MPNSDKYRVFSYIFHLDFVHTCAPPTTQCENRRGLFGKTGAHEERMRIQCTKCMTYVTTYVVIKAISLYSEYIIFSEGTRKDAGQT